MKSLGYGTIEVDNGADALSTLAAGGRVDLMITDVGLPGGMNGRQVADAARVSRPDLKVLFITGYAENAVFSHGHLDDGMEMMSKPFDVDLLARRAKTLIDLPVR
jgi:CheY-like chemotaxis protein